MSQDGELDELVRSGGAGRHLATLVSTALSAMQQIHARREQQLMAASRDDEQRARQQRAELQAERHVQKARWHIAEDTARWPYYDPNQLAEAIASAHHWSGQDAAAARASAAASQELQRREPHTPRTERTDTVVTTNLDATGEALDRTLRTADNLTADQEPHNSTELAAAAEDTQRAHAAGSDALADETAANDPTVTLPTAAEAAEHAHQRTGDEETLLNQAAEHTAATGIYQDSASSDVVAAGKAFTVSTADALAAGPPTPNHRPARSKRQHQARTRDERTR